MNSERSVSETELTSFSIYIRHPQLGLWQMDEFHFMHALLPTHTLTLANSKL